MITESHDRIIFALYLLESFQDAPEENKNDVIWAIHELVQSAYIGKDDILLPALSEDTNILMSTHKAIAAINNARDQEGLNHE